MNALTISLEDLPGVASRLVDKLAQTPATEATVLTLSGNLGAGKTTFVQAIAAHLGVTESVQSPTFVIMKRYDTTSKVFRTLIHIDAYRIEDVGELAPLHFAAVLKQPGTLVCIEWPEHIATALPDTVYALELKVVDASTRRLTGWSSAI